MEPNKEGRGTVRRIPQKATQKSDECQISSYHVEQNCASKQ